MDTSNQAAIGEQVAAPGQTLVKLRAGRLGDLIVNAAGKYGELAKSGRLFHGCSAVAGVAPGTTIGTTAAVALANPLGSNVDLVIYEALMTYISGTLGTGTIDWIAHKRNLILPTGTAIEAQNAMIDGPDGTGRMLETATVLTGGNLVRPFAYLPPMLASSVQVPWTLIDKVEGAIIVRPGTSVSLQATAAAGTSPLVQFGFLWGEHPA